MLSFNKDFNLYLHFLKIGENMAAIAYLCHIIDLACVWRIFVTGYYLSNDYCFKCIIISEIGFVAIS